jgi:O-acetyl-ADP-ribose deacetylase (regulator of RNase III)
MASRVFAGTTLDLVFGNIVHERTDAIVNAANRSLLGGGGVDGAIHAHGGPAILEECRRLGGCGTGDAKITGAGRLRARWVIHAVGPVWQDGESGEPELLARAYRRSLAVAAEHGARSVAFPSLSTGAFRFPIREAAPIALRAVVDGVEAHPGAFDLLRFVLFSQADLLVYEDALAAL